ncbi:MAG: UDP-glucose/GDP-mannose dehydrogenase family protein [Actinobacteria bacterium]|nr:UDP-glucose/GDP-mannose dehydrogenase family protein [Actinomycetota bacterium]
MADPQRIGVVGVGYVGLVTGACFASLGHHVTLRDIDASKVGRLRVGDVPIHEPGLSEMIAAHRQRMAFTLDLEELLASSEILFVAVDTPPTYSGDADLSRVMTVIDELARARAGARHVIVMKSTVPVGTGDRLRAALDFRDLTDVAYVSNPEFLREGVALDDFLNPDRVVIGAQDDDAADRVAALYEGFRAPVIRTTVSSAEMIKYASNAFLATKISFINEIANVCEEVGADVSVVARGMGLDERIGPQFLRAGLGYGGSCFPKDVSALKQLAGNSGYHFQLLNAVIEVNELQKRRVVGKLKRHLGALKGRRVALLGLAFKPGTDDTREASSLVVAARLLAEGAEVRVCDPVAIESAKQRLSGVAFCEDAHDALTDADAAILITEWPQFVALDWPKIAGLMRQPLVIDGCNALDAASMGAAGFVYEGVGRAIPRFEEDD